MVIGNSDPGAPYFVTHHQPFNYFARFAPGTPERERHLKDYNDLVAGIDAGELPAVAFYKPQIRAYRRALAALTGLSARGNAIRSTLLFVGKGVAVDV